MSFSSILRSSTRLVSRSSLLNHCSRQLSSPRSVRQFCAQRATPTATNVRTATDAGLSRTGEAPGTKPSEPSPSTLTPKPAGEATSSSVPPASNTSSAPTPSSGTAATAEASAPGVTATSATTSRTTGVSAEAINAKVPDVPASSLGLLEEADAKDPNMWKKYLWKYVGALIVFMVSYKTLHWYVDRVEEDGKRRREELEEDKKLAEEIRAKDAERARKAQMPFPISPVSPSVSATASSASAATAPVSRIPQQPQPSPAPNTEPLEFFEKMAATVVPTSSGLDALYDYQRELQGKIQQGGDASQLSDWKEELASVEEEIKLLVSKGKK